MFALFLMIFHIAYAEPTNSVLKTVLDSNATATTTNEKVGIDEPPVLLEPTKEEAENRTFELSKKLRCPVCQGLSVADSRSDAAVAMKNRIQELVEMGYSDEQIVNYFIGRYGEWALLKPKYEHRFVWVAPIVLTVLGLGFVGWRISRNQGRTNRSHSMHELQSDTDFDEKEPDKNAKTDMTKQAYREQVLRELDE